MEYEKPDEGVRECLGVGLGVGVLMQVYMNFDFVCVLADTYVSPEV